MNESKSWTMLLAQDFLIRLEAALGGTHHVGLLGSVLLRGGSNKDLDIAVYPHDTTAHEFFEHRRIKAALLDVGLHRVADVEAVWDEWKKKGSSDGKLVEIWRTQEGRRVDVFYLR